MAQIHQSTIMGIFKNENTLKGHLSQLELLFESDVICYYALIDETFINHLLRIARETKAKSNRKRLTILLMSKGGEMKPVKTFYDEIYNIYDELYIIATEYAFSAATLFCFCADKLFIRWFNTGGNTNGAVFFGMIDPQRIQKNQETGQDVYVSAFNVIGQAHFKYELQDRDTLKDSFTYSNEHGLTIDHYHVHQSFLDIEFVRELAYDALINHHFKHDCNEKQKKAIAIINYLMNTKIHHHDDHIQCFLLQERGLLLNILSEEEKTATVYIKDYNETVFKILDDGGKFNYVSNNFGNKLNCLIQSVNELLI